MKLWKCTICGLVVNCWQQPEGIKGYTDGTEETEHDCEFEEAE